MKILRYLFLILCAAAELFFLVFGIIGISLYWGTNNPNVPIAMVLSEAVLSLVMLGLTITSAFMVKKEKRFPVLWPFLMKIPAVILWLGISWFALDIPQAGWVGVILAAILAALFIALPKLSDGGVPEHRQQKAVKLPEFRSDKAKWAWEDAAVEYLRLHGQIIDTDTEEGKQALAEYARNISDSESDRIYDYAGMPIAYFLGWLIRRDLMSKEFHDICNAEDIESVKEERLAPTAVLQSLDYVLSREDIAPEAHRFMDLYYNYEERLGPYSHRSRKYFFDYYKAVCSGFDVPRYYCAEFSLSSFHKLAAVLDRRYREFNDYGFDEDELEDTGRSVRSLYFDRQAELFREPGTPDEYVERCACAFENMSEQLMRDLCENLIEYCPEELTEEDMLPEKVLPFFEPGRMIVLKPEPAGPSETTGADEAAEEPPAYLLLGSSEWEEERGISFTVIGDYVVNCAYYADAESPWEEDMQWKYRIRRDAEDGNYSMVNLIPERFGGSAAADNQISVPAAARERKEELDDIVEALFMLKIAASYDCRITYDQNVPNYMFISATRGKTRTFADSLPLR